MRHLRLHVHLHVRAVFVLSVLVGLLAVPLVAQEPPAASLEDLAWMTGSWTGSLGPNTIEEHWTQPESGSLAALVRMTNPEATAMIELIVVEEEGDSLVLRLQQWDPGFEPRTEGPQTLRLEEIGERSVTFEAASEGGLQELAYSRPAEDRFVIDILTAQGGALKIELEAMD